MEQDFSCSQRDSQNKSSMTLECEFTMDEQYCSKKQAQVAGVVWCELTGLNSKYQHVSVTVVMLRTPSRMLFEEL
jgi:hypothetical protein